MRKLAAIVSLAGAGLLLASACGDGDGLKREEPPETHAEDDLARSLLLTVNDFPTGWAEELGEEDDEDNPFDQCDPGPPPGRTGIAETGDFSKGGTEEVSQQVGVFDSAQDATAALDRYPSTGDCVVKLINDGKLDTSEWEFSQASFSRVSFPSYGTKSQAFRVEAHIKVKGESGLGSEGDFYIDLVLVARGRLAFFIRALDIFTPFSSSDLESIVSKAEEKIPDNE
jgi:hypothetical protein